MYTRRSSSLKVQSLLQPQIKEEQHYLERPLLSPYLIVRGCCCRSVVYGDRTLLRTVALVPYDVKQNKSTSGRWICFVLRNQCTSTCPAEQRGVFMVVTVGTRGQEIIFVCTFLTTLCWRNFDKENACVLILRQPMSNNIISYVQSADVKIPVLLLVRV